MSKTKSSVKNSRPNKIENGKTKPMEEVVPPKPLKKKIVPPSLQAKKEDSSEICDFETERKRYAARTPTYEDLVKQVKELDETLDAYEIWVKQNAKTIQNQEEFIQTLMKKLKSIGFVYVPEDES